MRLDVIIRIELDDKTVIELTPEQLDNLRSIIDQTFPVPDVDYEEEELDKQLVTH